MKPSFFSCNFSDLGIKPEMLEDLMGYADENSPEPFPTIINDVLIEADSYSEIKGGYLIHKNISIDPFNNSITINEVEFLPKKIVIRRLKEARHAALFVCTAGEGIGLWAKSLMKSGDMMKGYTVDILGSLIVETAMDKIHDQLEKDMNLKGMGVTDRYSPGYCGWDVKEQKKLFRFFPNDFCGIKLMESSFMYPVKSISGIIGIGKNANRKNYACQLCKDPNCIYRNKRHQ
jgi:hypothetical protein